MCQDPNVQAADDWDREQIANEVSDAAKDEAIADMVAYIWSDPDVLQEIMADTVNEDFNEWIKAFGEEMGKGSVMDAGIEIIAMIVVDVKATAKRMVEDLE